jgi:hypothetical protein
MKHIKRHIKRVQKIKVHHNRWLIWAVSLTVIACFMLLSYIKITDYVLDYQSMDTALINDNGVIYKDNVLGFSLYHPKDWGVESEVRDTITFNDPKNNGAGLEVSLYELDDERALRDVLEISREQTVFVDDQKGARLTVTDGRKTIESVVLVPHDGMLYVIRGSTAWFDQVLSSFKFIARSANN